MGHEDNKTQILVGRYQRAKRLPNMKRQFNLKMLDLQLQVMRRHEE